MKKETNMVAVKERDAKALTKTIVEVEASQELYEKAIADGQHAPLAFKDVLDNYMKSISRHKEVWRDILSKYIDEDGLLFYRDNYRYDVYKKVIFLPEEVLEAE